MNFINNQTASIKYRLFKPKKNYTNRFLITAFIVAITIIYKFYVWLALRIGVKPTSSGTRTRTVYTVKPDGFLPKRPNRWINKASDEEIGSNKEGRGNENF